MRIKVIHLGLLDLRGGRGCHNPLLALCLLLAGCAVTPRGPVPVELGPAAACLALFERADAEVAAAGVGDAAAARVDGFPWLRVSRPLASFRHEVTSAERFAAWVDRLAALDREARFHELRNLPAPARQRLRNQWFAAAQAQQMPARPMAAMQHCRERLTVELNGDPIAQQRLRASAVAPDEYVAWQRFLGLYPLSSRIARHGIVRLHQRLASRFADPVSADGRVLQYAVRAQRAATRSQIGSILQQMNGDALGIPRPSRHTAELLLGAHAPLWSVVTQDQADRPGALVLDEGARPLVDIAHPTEYRWWSWTRFKDQVLLQLNYALWFPERRAGGVFDIAAGHLDGVIWRVTLLPGGEVLAYESVHTCGCYYTLVPNPQWRVAEQPAHEEPVFSPAQAPALAANQRMQVIRESGTHYFAGLAATSVAAGTQKLVVQPMDKLRSLPDPQGGFASVYGPRGLISASRRCERFVLWPLGVPSAGASRQPGTQAIAFVGKRHFDDPRLLENLLAPREED